MTEYSVKYLNDKGSEYAMACLMKCIAHGEPFVTYGRIARYLEQRLEIPKVFSTHPGGVVGTMMNRILEIDPDAPLINALTTQSNGIPGVGVASYINKKHLKTRKKKWADLSKRQKLKIVEKIRRDVRSYSRWNEIYKELFGELAIDNYPKEKIKEGPGTGYGGGESDAHKALKNWVTKNPKKVGAPENFDKVIIEAPLLSGDIVDVLFTDGKSFIAVEVKSKISSDDDFRRGIYQCVKYRAVLKAQELPVKAEVKTILVTERDLSGELIGRQKILGITYYKVSVN